MRKLVIGILAHVDAGKTTLSEAMLYVSGSIRKLGRVDNRDAFLDTYELERARGITIFSKQAEFTLKDTNVTLLDTPGHVDFSAEMERTLQVLDYAILVISGADGVQGHTRTLWDLLKKYNIPVFLFINKMDQNGTDKEALLQELKSRLDDGCTDFTDQETNDFYETVAVSDELALEHFLEHGTIELETIQTLIRERKVFPCFFGSALKLDGVEEFMQSVDKYSKERTYPEQFGAKVYKIGRDDQGTRLTYLKVTGGTLKVKDLLSSKETPEDGGWKEKVNQIRIYSGGKFTAVNEAEKGTVCAVTGLNFTRPGDGLGIEEASMGPILEPVLTYKIELPEGCDATKMLGNLRELEEEEPELHIVWNEELQEIQAQVMGEVQIEILKSIILERFGVSVEFGTGNIVYKETINNVVEGVGHFEPLRHYAEVHLLLEPLERGSGMQFATDCSEDVLDRNWQRLVMTHLYEKEHRGVLTGSVITDIKITLVAGRAHQKHTEGGDFRQATYRAVRQGLKQAESILLEPYYEFRLEVPQNTIGRAMTDIEKRCGTFEIPVNEGEMAVLTGMVPVITMQDYHNEVIAYTKGTGRLFCTLSGYGPCHNEEQVIEQFGYDSERDLENPTGSVFCSHGAGFTVSWDEVADYMHIESVLQKEKEEESLSDTSYQAPYEEEWMDVDEIDEILSRTFYSNKKEKSSSYRAMSAKRLDAYRSSGPRTSRMKKGLEEYLLVDGYNIIFAWDELKELAKVNIDAARDRLTDILCNYQGMKKVNLILVFDAYRVQGHVTEIINYHNIHIVYTKEAETADQYIEKFAHENKEKYDVTVATSDGLEQVIIRGQGCKLLSARELKAEIETMNETIRGQYLETQAPNKTFLFDGISKEVAKKVEDIRTGEEE